MAKTKTLPEHRRVLKKQAGWIRYTVPGLDDVKAYFNGTTEELQVYLENLMRKRKIFNNPLVSHTRTLTLNQKKMLERLENTHDKT